MEVPDFLRLYKTKIFYKILRFHICFRVVYIDNIKVLLQDPKVDAVVISTPATSHYSLVKEFILADKDVFVEKPIALSYGEGQELVFLANERNIILMVGHILQYHPAIVKLKNFINQGKLGKINYVYSNRLNLGKIRTEENILWSFAPHDIAVIVDLLGEMPTKVSAYGGNYLNPYVTDVTVTTMDFPSATKSHIFVSWLHPYKEQKLVIVGEKKMAMFDDVNPENKLFIYDHKIDWIDRRPIPRAKEPQAIEVERKEPLRAECEHFLDCIISRKTPITDGPSGLRVLEILEACQKSLRKNGDVYHLTKNENKKYFIHESSYIDEDVEIEAGTKIWHFSHILKNTRIGKNCNVGQNVVIGPNVNVGNNVKIQNNVSIYDGVSLEDDVFCGPSMVFTNVLNPRSHWPRKDEYKKTKVKKGASLGAHSTILCGITIGQYVFIGAGALVDRDVPDYSIFYGIPAKIQGWMCYCGVKLNLSISYDSEEEAECTNCERKYLKKGYNVYQNG